MNDYRLPMKLAHGDRQTLVVHKALAQAIKQLSRSDEHFWQATHRIMLMGIEAARQEQMGKAS